MRPGRHACVLAGAALALGAGHAPAAKPPPCPAGIFQVDAASPLVPGGAVPDVVVVGDDGSIAIASGCPAIAGKRKSTRKGTTLAAKWTRRRGLCTGIPGKASLKARFDAACETLTGKFASKGRKLRFTATRLGVELDGRVPASVAGEPLLVTHATGPDMLAADATWADTFASLGAAAGGVAVSTAVPFPGSALDLHVTAWTAPGAGWAQRVADFAAGIAAHPASGYAAEELTLGGHAVWKVTVPADPASAAVYYVVTGDTLLLFTSSDEALVGRVLAEIPAAGPVARATGGPRGTTPPPPGGFILAVRLLRPVDSRVCVAEPFGRVTLDVMAIDGFYQVPVPALFVVNDLSIGEVTPLTAFGGAATFFYQAVLYDPEEDLTVQAVAPAGGQGFGPVVFPVRHCLNGTWQDGDRVVEVTQVVDHLVARLVSGDICGDTDGNDFTGDMTGPDRFAGSDLKVCNPSQCVEAGVLEPSVLVPYTATVARDGQSAEIFWESVQFDLVYDDGGQLVGCPPNGDVQPTSFFVYRLTFGPSLP